MGPSTLAPDCEVKLFQISGCFRLRPPVPQALNDRCPCNVTPVIIVHGTGASFRQVRQKFSVLHSYSSTQPNGTSHSRLFPGSPRPMPSSPMFMLRYYQNLIKKCHLLAPLTARESNPKQEGKSARRTKETGDHFDPFSPPNTFPSSDHLRLAFPGTANASAAEESLTGRSYPDKNCLSLLSRRNECCFRCSLRTARGFCCRDCKDRPGPNSVANTRTSFVLHRLALS